MRIPHLHENSDVKIFDDLFWPFHTQTILYLISDEFGKNFGHFAKSMNLTKTTAVNDGLIALHYRNTDKKMAHIPMEQGVYDDHSEQQRKPAEYWAL